MKDSTKRLRSMVAQMTQVNDEAETDCGKWLRERSDDDLFAMLDECLEQIKWTAGIYHKRWMDHPTEARIELPVMYAVHRLAMIAARTTISEVIIERTHGIIDEALAEQRARRSRGADGAD